MPSGATFHVKHSLPLDHVAWANFLGARIRALARPTLLEQMEENARHVLADLVLEIDLWRLRQE